MVFLWSSPFHEAETRSLPAKGDIQSDPRWRPNRTSLAPYRPEEILILGGIFATNLHPLFLPWLVVEKKNIRKPLEVTLFGLGIEFFMKRWVSATEWQKSAPAPYMHPASGSGTSLSGASNNQTRSSIIDALHIYIWINGYRDKWIKGEMDRLKA